MPVFGRQHAPLHNFGPQKRANFFGRRLAFLERQTTHAGGVSVLRNSAGPPRRVPRAAAHSRRGRERFPAEKKASCVQNVSPVFRGHTPEIRQFGSKTGQNSRSPRCLPRVARRFRSRRERFPAEKTGAGTQNLSLVFRGPPPLESDGLPPKTGQFCGAPPPLSEGRKTLTSPA